MRALWQRPHAFRVLVLAVAGVAACLPVLSAQEPQTPAVIFRASRDVVSIDVVVRDRSGAIVRGLSAGDFEIREDGRPQQLLTSSFQEIDDASPPSEEAPMLQRLGFSPISQASASAPPSELNGRRLVMLLFDLSAMEPDEVERIVQAALQYVDTQMSNADLVAVASLTWELKVLTDFTGNRAALRTVLQSLVAVDLSTGEPSGGEPPGDLALNAGGTVSRAAATDSRLRALRLIADALTPVGQKKALLYFTGGLGNAAQDSPAELRAATTAATSANLAIYPVDARGLRAVVPSGPARTASRDGEGLFSGQDVNDQFSELTESKDTVVALASATGGRVFDGANSLGAAFTRVQRDTAAYYLLGYSSSSTARDGRFRRVQVRVLRKGVHVEARAGYYGERDFARTGRADREAQLEERLVMPVEPSALDVRAAMAWFQLARGRSRVPLTITGHNLPQRMSGDAVKMDVLAVVEDERGRTLARLRDTVEVSTSAGRAAASFAYTSSVVLPPGRFTLKAVVRENVEGVIGSARAEILVPDLTRESLAVSAPLVRIGPGGTSPSLYVEVYDALAKAGTETSLVVGAAFFRDSVRVFEAELPGTIGRSDLAAGTTAYELPIGTGTIDRGRYLCQITVVDPVSGRFALTRTDIDIR